MAVVDLADGYACARLAAKAFQAMADDRNAVFNDDETLMIAIACMSMLDTIRDSIGGKNGQHAQGRT